jgi:RNA polymerase sigma-70 factor (ECF subfamily)
MHFTDEEIVQEVLAGSRQRYAEIVSRYQRPVFNLMYRYTHHEQDAADLTQEVFLRVFERLSSYRPERSFFSWLYTLAINNANDWSRSRKLRQERIQAYTLEDEPILEVNTPMAGIENREERQLLEKAMNLLLPETREILVLRYRHEMPLREIAVVFGITDSAVKMRVKRGVEQLQGILREMHGDGTENS